MSDAQSEIKVKGDSVEDKVKSIELHLNSLNRKPTKTIVKVLTSVPVLAELGMVNAIYPVLITNKKGFIEDLIVYIEETSAKKLNIHLIIQEGIETRTVKVNSAKGFTNANGKYDINPVNTIVYLSYSIEEGGVTTPPIVGFSYKEDKEVI